MAKKSKPPHHAPAPPPPPPPQDPTLLERLRHEEAHVERAFAGLRKSTHHFFEVGRHFALILDEALYRALGDSSFEVYCDRHQGRSKSWIYGAIIAYRLMSVHGVPQTEVEKSVLIEIARAPYEAHAALLELVRAAISR